MCSLVQVELTNEIGKMVEDLLKKSSEEGYEFKTPEDGYIFGKSNIPFDDS